MFQKPTPFSMSIYDNIARCRLFENRRRPIWMIRLEWALQKALWDRGRDK